jgi:hypothetical protein
MRQCLLVAMIGMALCAGAQEFGGIPSSLKWKQVNSPNVKVIFPAGLDSSAKRVAAISDLLHTRTASTIGQENRKISIVLQSETTISNGYVQLAPWRSEFFLTPLQNSLRLGSLPWTDQLAIHEYRHVQQYMNFRQGLSKFAYIIAGQEGQLLANSAAIPDWFFEGDAVFQETLVTGQGRGRLPAFYNEFRSLWEANRRYSYMKIRNGSFRHLTPDHYSLGYMLVSYGRETYGDDIWRKVTRDAAAFRPLFYPMQGAIKKHTGKDFRQFVNEAIAFHRDNREYQGTDERRMRTRPSEGFVQSYAFPRISGDTAIALKTTGREIPRFVMLQDGGEKKMMVRDIALDEPFSYRNGKIVYAAYRPDVRWGYRDYSDLRIIDVHTGKRNWLTRKSKYFAPDLAHDGRTVAAVRVDPGGRSTVDLMDATTGKTLRSLTAGHSSLFHTYPRFSGDDRALFIPVRRGDGRMSIYRWDLNTGEADTLLPFTYQAISFPVVKGDTLFFTAVRGGQDILMVWDDKGKRLHEALNSYAGIQQSAPRGDGTVMYAGLSAWGNMLFDARPDLKEISPAQWISGDPGDLYVKKALSGETQVNDLPYREYPVTRYGKAHGLFNFHSWRPYYDQPIWSLSLYGNNVLNTFSSALGYKYNQNESSHKLDYSAAYSAWFPWIEGGVGYTFDRRFRGTQRTIYWNELSANLGVRIPLNLTSGRLFTNLQFSSLYNVLKVMFNERKNGRVFEDLNLNYLDNSVAFTLQTQKAEQQIFPRFAFTLFADHRNSVNRTEAWQTYVNTGLFLPGLLRTHSLVFNFSYQARDTAQNYLFSDNFAYSRGYPAANFPRMWKVGVNYHLPLLYPDKGIANIVYFLRVRANLFYDHTNLKSLRTGIVTPMRSAGTEIYFDTRWWNQQNVSFGIRYSRLFDAELFNGIYSSPVSPNQWEIVLPINLIPR